jgi:hypothetical protein
MNCTLICCCQVTCDLATTAASHGLTTDSAPGTVAPTMSSPPALVILPDYEWSGRQPLEGNFHLDNAVLHVTPEGSELVVNGTVELSGVQIALTSRNSHY